MVSTIYDSGNEVGPLVSIDGAQRTESHYLALQVLLCAGKLGDTTMLTPRYQAVPGGVYDLQYGLALFQYFAY